jgi:hypothetical protein
VLNRETLNRETLIIFSTHGTVKRLGGNKGNSLPTTPSSEERKKYGMLLFILWSGNVRLSAVQYMK